ncbi:hypothetical protein HZB02_04530 [Candidatus Woesearchaeota archaeon]|nr:hypothetical protein [Candidatus Woesearchaeota archaeon]
MTKAPLDEILLRMKGVDQSLVSDDIYSAMGSAVTLCPLDQVHSDYKEKPAPERCSLLLESYRELLQNLGVKDPVGQAYRNLASELKQRPSVGTASTTLHYRTWRLVLDQYQEKNALR